LHEAIHGSVRHVPGACILLGALAGIVPAAVAEPRTALIVGNGGRFGLRGLWAGGQGEDVLTPAR
jgi:hypothetical protein